MRFSFVKGQRTTQIEIAQVFFVFLQILYKDCFAHFGQKKIFLFNKNIYNKRSVYGTLIRNLNFLCRTHTGHTDGQTDDKTDRSVKTEGPLMFMSPCAVSFKLDLDCFKYMMTYSSHLNVLTGCISIEISAPVYKI